MSKWLHDKERAEDEKLADYLLSFELPYTGKRYRVNGQLPEKLPPWFSDLLEKDIRVRNAWSGIGKRDGADNSGSGYDFYLVSLLLEKGYRNLDDLVAVLVLRPEGSFRKSSKGLDYVVRTVGSAITKMKYECKPLHAVNE